MSKARGLADLGNVYNDGALSNRNLIINGAMQVAQRGTSAAYSSNISRGFVCDRWFAEGYPLNMTVTQSTIAYDGITYKSSSLSSITGNWAFFQCIEDGRIYNHTKTMTFSFVASGSGAVQPVTWAGTQRNFGSSIALTSTPTRYEVTHTLEAAATGDNLFIGLAGSGGSMNISLTQLEVGDTATPFEHRSFGQELALCQRYFQIFKEDGSTTTFGSAIAYNTTAAYDGTQHVFPVEMRVVPTRSTTGSFGATDGLGSSLGVTSLYGTINRWGYTLGFGVASGLTAGKLYFVRASPASGSTLKFDAEL